MEAAAGGEEAGEKASAAWEGQWPKAEFAVVEKEAILKASVMWGGAAESRNRRGHGEEKPV